MQHVADDGHPQAVQITGRPPEPAPDGERVQQGLGRVLVSAVARVDHAALDPGGEPMSRTGIGVTDDYGVCAHRFERQGGVLERFALGHARTLGREVDDVGGQPLGRQFDDVRVRVESS